MGHAIPGAEVRARACHGESGSPEMGSNRDPLSPLRFLIIIIVQ